MAGPRGGGGGARADPLLASTQLWFDRDFIVGELPKTQSVMLHTSILKNSVYAFAISKPQLKFPFIESSLTKNYVKLPWYHGVVTLFTVTVTDHSARTCGSATIGREATRPLRTGEGGPGGRQRLNNNRRIVPASGKEPKFLEQASVR